MRWFIQAHHSLQLLGKPDAAETAAPARARECKRGDACHSNSGVYRWRVFSSFSSPSSSLLLIHLPRTRPLPVRRHHLEAPRTRRAEGIVVARGCAGLPNSVGLRRGRHPRECGECVRHIAHGTPPEPPAEKLHGVDHSPEQIADAILRAVNTRTSTCDIMMSTIRRNR